MFVYVSIFDVHVRPSEVVADIAAWKKHSTNERNLLAMSYSIVTSSSGRKKGQRRVSGKASVDETRCDFQSLHLL